jgi:hypothetical protein
MTFFSRNTDMIIIGDVTADARRLRWILHAALSVLIVLSAAAVLFRNVDTGATDLVEDKEDEEVGLHPLPVDKMKHLLTSLTDNSKLCEKKDDIINLFQKLLKKLGAEV